MSGGGSSWSHRIEVPVNCSRGRPVVRVSHHFYTTEAEIDQLAAVLTAG